VQTPSSAPAEGTAAEPPKKRRSKKALEHFGPLPDEAAPSPAPAPTAAPAPSPVPATAPPAPAAGAELPPDGPPLPVSESPRLDELVRISTTSPSAAQRIELIQKFNGIKAGAVVASLRANAQSAHPAVRAAAEAVMAAMFGPNWNRTAAIPKPVQPPHTDDKDRGPPGGW
jgi:hypothetical protein